MNTAVSVADSLASKSSKMRTRVLADYFLVDFFSSYSDKQKLRSSNVTQNMKEDEKRKVRKNF